MFIDSEVGWGATGLGLFETQDGGRTWQSVQTSGTQSFQRIHSTSAGHLWIAGTQYVADKQNGLLLYSSDGEKWISKILDGIPPLVAVTFADAMTGWATGQGSIVRTVDGGDTWHPLRVEVPQGTLLFDVEAVDSTHVWAVGSNGTIVCSRDAGETWGFQDSVTEATLLRICSDSSEVWAVGLDGTVVHSRGGGAPWRQCQIGTSEPLCDIQFRGREGWIVGFAGTVYYTSDSGQTWSRQSVPTTENLTCLFVDQAGRVWIGGEHLTVLRLD